MRKYQPLILKENITNANDLAKEIEKEILQIFPHSHVDVSFSSHFISSIVIYFALGKDRNEWVNGIIQNDPAYMILHIYGVKEDNIDKEGNIKGLIELRNDGSSFYVKPSEGSHLAMERIKVPFRKFTTDNPEKVVEYIKKYFTLLKQMLQKHRNDLRDDDLKLIGHKF